MADVVRVGERVVNKIGKSGVITTFDGQYISVDFQEQVTKFLSDAFEKGFLKYEKTDLQNDIDQMVAQVQQEEQQQLDQQRMRKERAADDRRRIQAELSKKYFKVAVTAATVRLDAAPLTLRSVRKKDQDLIQEIFAECDRETDDLYAAFDPDMAYLRDTSVSARVSKGCIGFVCRYKDTYVVRVFSRNDLYRNSLTDGVTIRNSDTTEVLRILRVNDRDYWFSKHFYCSGGHASNSLSYGNWHVADVDRASLMLQKVIKRCDCGYVDSYVEKNRIECMQYVKLLFAALRNNKAEIVFKHGQFLPLYRVSDIVGYLDGFSSKQIDFACKNNVLNTLPLIKQYGIVDLAILQSMEEVLKVRKGGVSIYDAVAQHLQRLHLECEDLSQEFLRFVKKIGQIQPAVYSDYVAQLAVRPGVTLADFFDKDYHERHWIMTLEKRAQPTPQEEKQYELMAQELSWINREENGYHIILPKTVAEFQYEGAEQHNCVYTNQYYLDVIDRRSIVVFLRRDKEVPYVTIEFDYETFAVLQAYGKYNRNIPTPLYQQIVDLGKQLHYEMLSQQ